MIQSGYTKLFGSIVASTIWREDDKTRLVWITLLALSDRDGYVAGSLPGLADLARVTIEDCEKALEKLQQPDKYSRSPEHDGRRIEAIEGGWFILNRAKYRDLVPDEHRREVDRARQQRYRRKQKGDAVSRVTDRDSHETSRKTEKETNTEKKNSNPAAENAEGDPRHSPIRHEICKLWLAANNEIPTAPWDGREGNLLNRFLKENLSWNLEVCIACIRNRFASEANQSERPSRWIADLSAYASGPLDRFKQPLGIGRLSKAQQRIQRNRQVLIEAAYGQTYAEPGMRGRPSDAQFLGSSREFPPCPFGECDGSTWYINRATRQRTECRCARSGKSAAAASIQGR